MSPNFGKGITFFSNLVPMPLQEKPERFVAEVTEKFLAYSLLLQYFNRQKASASAPWQPYSLSNQFTPQSSSQYNDLARWNFKGQADKIKRNFNQ